MTKSDVWFSVRFTFPLRFVAENVAGTARRSTWRSGGGGPGSQGYGRIPEHFMPTLDYTNIFSRSLFNRVISNADFEVNTLTPFRCLW